MSRRAAVFAIPGDIATLTGGYIYERRLLHGLRASGHMVAHLELGDSFPAPTPAHLAEAVAALGAIDRGQALILDGLVYGAIDPAGLTRVSAPIVAMIHHPLAKETGLSPGRARHLLETERANLALAAAVLVPSPHTADILRTEYAVPPERITIAPPGTDRPDARRDPVSPPLILSVGIQHPRKGHDVLLRALARLTDLPWNAVIAGGAHDAGHAAELARLVDSLRLSDRVHLAGRVSQEDLESLYAKASIFALATRYEGYGMVFNEALSWGLSIVTCATGAVPDTVPAEAGLLVPPDDPGAFAEALRRFLSDDSRRNRHAAAAALAGEALPSWSDTARIASAVLDGLAS